MSSIDLVIVVLYLTYVVVDSLRRSRGTDQLDGYFLGGRSLPWWAVGLSVMATQLSAVTMIGTTGQGATDGLRFVQFYFGLPLAMVIISLTLVPFFHRAKIYTAYEYLERRFDARTRTLTSLLFLLQRGLSCGTIVSAPAIVFSVMLGWSLPTTVALIGAPTVLYTMVGGVQAVAWADVKQMVLVVFGLSAMVVVLLLGLPPDVHVTDALAIAGSIGRLNAFDFRPSLTETYTFWSGLIGGLFLMMSYFGTDQSQVQRYLTAKSVDEARTSLMMSAYWKIPLQVLVLMVGVLVFVFYVFTTPPMVFNPIEDMRVRGGASGVAYQATEAEFQEAWRLRRDAAEAVGRARRSGSASAASDALAAFARADKTVDEVRGRARDLVRAATGDTKARDVNYIIPTFILTKLPVGLAGLIIASIIAAAMSAVSAELNSLATTTVIDFYRRRVNAHATDTHYLLASKVATVFWGIFACIVGLYAAELGSLIEVVNKFGSYFYGSILGVFLLGTMTTRATGRGAFYGALAGLTGVGLVAFAVPSVAYLWYNALGAITVFVVGYLVSLTSPPPSPRAA